MRGAAEERAAPLVAVAPAIRIHNTASTALGFSICFFLARFEAGDRREFIAVDEASTPGPRLKGPSVLRDYIESIIY